jgi:hypothetical protein
MERAEAPEIQGILVFTHDEVEIEPNDAPIPAVPLKKLKEFMRQKAKDQPLSIEKIKQISEQLK